MKETIADMIKAKEMLETEIYDIPRFERIYAFSNENLKECFKIFDIQNKKCLTVLGSSDQAFDLFLKGAKEVDAFDVNPLTKHYFYLKKAAIQANLTKKEYLDFFNGYGANARATALNKEMYRKIQLFLEKEERLFWDYLFDNYASEDISTHLFSREILNSKMFEKTIEYLSDEGFQELKKKIHNVKINFYHQDLINLPEVLNNTYDFIYLSNIIQYVDNMFQNYNIDGKKNQILNLLKYKAILERLKTKLNPQGKIMAGYIYAIEQEVEKEVTLNPVVRENVFPEEKYNYYYFGSIEDILDSTDFGKDYHNKKDGCFVYPSKH